jgi:hypothetical protein
MTIETSLLGRTVLQGYSGKPRGTIVAVFVDRGEVNVVVEGLPESSDNRSHLTTESIPGISLGPVTFSAKVVGTDATPMRLED